MIDLFGDSGFLYHIKYTALPTRVTLMESSPADFIWFFCSVNFQLKDAFGIKN